MLPEIVFLAQFFDSVPGQADFFVPDAAGFIVLLINGDIQLVFGDFQHFRHKFPGPGDNLIFEIIAKGKIAEHFKKCAVTCGFANVVNVACADTFLAGRYTLSGRDFLTGEIRFHRRHAGID